MIPHLKVICLSSLLLCGCKSLHISGTETAFVVEGRGCIPLSERARIHTRVINCDYAEVLMEIEF